MNQNNLCGIEVTIRSKELIKMDRKWHPNFVRYVEMIVAHSAYAGLFYERKDDGTVKWVVTGKSENGLKRRIWWDDQCRQLGIPIKPGCCAIAARMIHPTGRHVCQICGRELSIKYVYPHRQLIDAVNNYFGTSFGQADKTIFELVDELARNQDDLDFFAARFKLPSGLDKTRLLAEIRQISDACTGPLSPGVMSNSPDRFDGFHSDGLCCRSESDTGRHPSNLKTYTQDRRAYEEWADGDYNLANRIMGEYHKLKPSECPACHRTDKLTADHIGPISLGFRHHMYFAPMCRSCNSSKNNRFTYNDVQKLVALEQAGVKVASWHSTTMWNMLKRLIKDEESARDASRIMAAAHQNVLKLFSVIYRETGRDFLSRYLHPEYSMYDYRFEDFDPYHPEKTKIIRKPLDSANKRKNQERYVRIAFESLDEFDRKDNRKTKFILDQVRPSPQEIVAAINAGDYGRADALLAEAVRSIANLLFILDWPTWSERCNMPHDVSLSTGMRRLMLLCQIRANRTRA